MAEREDLRPMWEAVGRMTANFAVLELAVHHLVWEMLGHEAAIRVVIRGMVFGQLVDVVEALVKEGFPPDEGHRQRVGEVLRDLKRVKEERNSITHAALGQFEEAVELARVRDITKKERPSRRLSLSQVEGLVGRSDELVGKVVKLTREMQRVRA